MFTARTSDKRGRKREHAFAETRETAAKLVLEADPKAKTCSTSKAHEQPDGRLWDTGSDIRWHRREDILARPSTGRLGQA